MEAIKSSTSQALNTTTKLALAHPYQAAGFALSLPFTFAGSILSAIGFGAAGITAGSVAAGVQSTYPLVPAGGWFASLTSAGMGGTALVGTANAVGYIIGGLAVFGGKIVGGLIGMLGWLGQVWRG